MRNEFHNFMPLCMKIARLWQHYAPDWRFMQLMSNFAVWYGSDPFYMEDDEFSRQFLKFMDEIGAK